MARSGCCPWRPDESLEATGGVGELVYAGPNVMLGYAERSADLALGATLAELRTGDLARCADDGVWEVVGRRGRHAKVFGLRLDLDHLERQLDRRSEVSLVAVDDTLHVFTSRSRMADRLDRRGW